jgi:hypothetical protein
VERLTARISEKDVTQNWPTPPSKREEALALYQRKVLGTSDPAAHAAAVFKRLSAEQEEIARSIILRLVSVGIGGTAFRTAVATDDFSERDRGVLHRLVDEGLLTRKLAYDKKTEYVTIADERLIDGWPSLRGWIQEQEETHRLREMLEQRAQVWDRSGRPRLLLLAEGELGPALTVSRSCHPAVAGVRHTKRGAGVRNGKAEQP